MPRLPKLTPWMLALQAGLVAREHWLKVHPDDRVLLRDLITKSKGQPKNLSARERAELKRIVADLDAAAAAWKLAPLGKKMRRGR